MAPGWRADDIDTAPGTWYLVLVVPGGTGNKSCNKSHNRDGLDALEGPFGLVRLPQANTDYSFLVSRYVDVYKVYFTAE